MHILIMYLCRRDHVLFTYSPFHCIFIVSITLVHPGLFGGVHVAQLFVCVVLSFLCCLPSSCVLCIQWCQCLWGFHSLVFVLCLVYPIMPMSLRCPFACLRPVSCVSNDANVWGVHSRARWFHVVHRFNFLSCCAFYVFVLYLVPGVDCVFGIIWFDLLCLTPLSTIFQLYHGDQF